MPEKLGEASQAVSASLLISATHIDYVVHWDRSYKLVRLVCFLISHFMLFQASGFNIRFRIYFQNFATSKQSVTSLPYYLNAWTTWRMRTSFLAPCWDTVPRGSLSPTMVIMRNQLADFDHNVHVDRGAATTCATDRDAPEWLAYQMLKKKPYPYYSTCSSDMCLYFIMAVRKVMTTYAITTVLNNWFTLLWTLYDNEKSGVVSIDICRFITGLMGECLHRRYIAVVNKELQCS